MRSIAGWLALLGLAACGPIYPSRVQPGQGGAASAPAPTEASSAPAAPAPEPAPPTAPATSAPPAAASSGPAKGSVAARFLAAHNRVRAAHCAPPLRWSTQLARVAQRWADTLRAKGCMFGHSGGQYGENLAAGTEGVLDPEATVAMWADEEKQYRFPEGGFSMKTGHFTQVVWRDTTEVGCGHTTCQGNDIWVCNYAPAGNVDGEYRDNVKPAGCKR